MSNLTELTTNLKTALDLNNFIACEELLPSIKLELIKHGLLVPDLHKAKDNISYANDLIISRSIIETGALASVNLGKFEAFENYFSQLRPFYFSTDITALNTSTYKNKLISLYLLYLLSKRDITRFHEEIEYLSKRITNMEDDEYLSYPIKVEKWLMEGNYQKARNLLLLSENNGSSSESGFGNLKEYVLFTDILLEAIREEIAHNTEMAYDKLSLSATKTLLFFENEKEVEQFALDLNWKISKGMIYFKEDNKEFKNDEHDDKMVINNVLDYAINLETIV
ncbi:related to 26S proteasome regulatory subunit RPN12 [Saccharomycodes ludwigii]|uniref:Related to 26S proteasome regulatory subunit RPN12 n=1 Tax=Saccharomycodes ludwigii TaxID=36035 RepID=A0A376B9J3_9ASCO|nr:hypothetical protein SCDLUD_002250 [Saccharomycodes ludwigii]KAH3900797.1 hypothetical protein SCDLUD_002250 [Saccharomycodes ludwigii]SSD61204.1 related to 26S proteasome regulatory subunit RPN12 [Saccharomycodes ludwigii]